MSSLSAYWTHTASNCNLKYRCIKCKNENNHGPNECHLKGIQTDTSVLLCVRCGQNGHPASFSGCPKHIELLDRIKSQKESEKKNKSRKTCYVY